MLRSGTRREFNALRKGLRDLGYIEGQTIVLDFRFARGNLDALPELAAELVRLPVDVIVTDLIAFAQTQHIPAIFPSRYHTVSGGLISYGVDGRDQYRRAASYIDRILQGEKPGSLPVQQPTKFELDIVRRRKSGENHAACRPLSLWAGSFDRSGRLLNHNCVSR